MDPKAKNTQTPNESSVSEESSTPPPINLQKRDYDLDATRYGDWELNGRCVDF